MNPVPFVQELIPPPSVEETLSALRDWPDLLLFDSVLRRRRLGRYSFLTAEPFDNVVLDRPETGRDPFAAVRRMMESFATEAVAGLPPFQGGAAGLLSYELGGCFERLPEPAYDELSLPAMVIGLYDWVLAWDHEQRRCWFISHGFPETSARLRLLRSQSRLADIVEALRNPPARLPAVATTGSSMRGDVPIAEGEPLAGVDGLFGNFTHERYLEAVRRVIEYIRAGDIFQANLSQRLTTAAVRDPVEQYLLLRRHNPAPFAGYFAHEDWAVLSSSPERFLQLRDGEVVTRPIKGTRRRRTVPEADLFTREELRESEKDRAENVMIVDLLRNDLSRVCRSGSIRVPELCVVETYETVTHLVSEVRGVLREGMTFWDLLAATFPGGSITGAPKIRAMEIITELEQVARGAYCGSLFYCGFDGTADSNILIRTMTRRGGKLTFPVGGGVVAQSDPEEEYQETLHKAAGMLRSLKG